MLTQEDLAAHRQLEITPIYKRIETMRAISERLEAEVFEGIHEEGPEEDAILDALNAIDRAVNAAQVAAESIEAKYKILIQKAREE